MRRAGGDIVVNVASELGLVGGASSAACCASKGGVVQLSKAMAVDQGRQNIRVNCICPSPVATPLLTSIIATANNPGAEAQSIIASTLLKRIEQPEEIASAILIAASADSTFMAGATLAIDGDLTA